MTDDKKFESKKINKKMIIIISSIVGIIIVSLITIFVTIGIRNKYYLDGKYKYVDEIRHFYTPEEISTDTISENMKKYSHVVYEDNSYSKAFLYMCRPIDTKYISKKLGSGIAKGIDDKGVKEETNVEVYEILKVNNEAAIAVKFENENNYYSYCNLNYDFKNIDGLVNSLNLKEYLKFNGVTYKYVDKNKEYYDVYFYDVNNDDIFNAFFNDPNVKVSSASNKFNRASLYEIGIYDKALSKYNLSFTIFDDGYARMNLFEVGIEFEVGEKGKAFLEYLHKNYEGCVKR